MLFLGEVVKQLIDPLKGPDDKRSLMERVDIENFADWFSGSKGNIPKEFAETFLGSNIRAGVGQGIVSEIMDLYRGVAGSKTGVIESERSARTFGRLLGNYMSSWAVPLAQIVDMQRALGFRPSEKKDAAREPVLGDTSQTFMDKRTGAKILSGLNFGPEDGPEVQYLQNVFNYAPWKIGSKDKRPKVRAWDNENIRKQLPEIARKSRKEEVQARQDWNSMSDKFKSEHSERMYVKQRGTMFVEAALKDAREIVISKRIEMQRGQSTEVIKWQMFTDKFRKLPEAVRDFAWTEFVRRHGEREPDYNSADDLSRLVIYGEEYWKAYTSTLKKGKGLGSRR